VIENDRLTQEGKNDRLSQKSWSYKEMWKRQKRYQNMEKGTDFNG
tara:strand:+ start:147 stop:281 length:135 start_codon:yes stop_codon:yes gene_type:complete